MTADAKVPRFFLRLPLLQRLDNSRPGATSRNALRREEARRRHADRLSSYLPGLDGLRALAVLAVLLYHARPELLPGGFLGVEVFFVISGFIITRGLLREWQESGRIDLRAFWLRRARRLLPALFLLLAGVMAYVAIFETDAVAGLRADVLAALAYVTNWHLIAGDESYFASFEKPSMLLHLWSLAIEEQFYFVWPLLLAGLLPLLRKKATFVLIVGGIVASTAAMMLMYQPGADTSRLYYGTDTRAAALLAGAGLAFLYGNAILDPGRARRRLMALLGVVALVGLAASAYFLAEDAALLYRGGFLGVSLLTAGLIFFAPQRTLLTRLLELAPLRWAGVRSYGIYLWHWPIFLTAWPETPGLEILAAQVVATVVIAALSYRYLETPVRNGALGRAWSDLRAWGSLRPGYRSGMILAGNAVVAVIATLVIVGAQAQPPQQPDYFGLDGVRLRSTADTLRGEASPAPRPMSELLANFDSRLSRPDPMALSLTCSASTQPGVSLIASTCGGSEVVSVAISDAEDVVLPAHGEHDEAVTRESFMPAQSAAQAAKPVALEMPERRAVPADTPFVTAIGDSVMLGAATWLAGSIPNIDVDSQVGRQASSAIALLQDRLQTGQLGQIVLVHIGNNGSLTDYQFEQIMAVAGSERQVIFLNTRVPRTWQDANNAVLSAGVQRHTNSTLIDWHAVTQDHPELFAKDLIHLNGAGADLYTRLVVDAVLRKS